MEKKIFITGGAGYIGSHTCVEILKQNHQIMIFDSLINSSEEVFRRLELLTEKKIKFVIGDIRDQDRLTDAMQAFKPTSVIHFAGLKSVGESFTKPFQYYDVNVTGALNVLQAMLHTGCKEIVFSSSASVYGSACMPPYVETDFLDPISPY